MAEKKARPKIGKGTPRALFMREEARKPPLYPPPVFVATPKEEAIARSRDKLLAWAKEIYPAEMALVEGHAEEVKVHRASEL